MHDDLIAQAFALAMLDRKKPKQANLRRAVSAACYSLFHFLVHEACCLQIGTQNAQAPLRYVLGRAFVHATMKQACISFAGGTLKASVAKGLPTSFSIPQPVQQVAATFVELQEHRHVADYDLTGRFRRSEVLTLIEQAAAVTADFKRLPPSNADFRGPETR